VSSNQTAREAARKAWAKQRAKFPIPDLHILPDGHYQEFEGMKNKHEFRKAIRLKAIAKYGRKQ
jgi:hypothetical protein